MKERPILMSAPMIRAILAGKKTQTRRTIPLKWFGQEDYEKQYPYNLSFPDKYGDYHKAEDICKYGRKGDRLWVRENLYNYDGDWGYTGSFGEEMGEYPDDWKDKNSHKGTIPSIHMPRWASRITLEITNIRVERLKDINREDAIAEGMCHLAEVGYDKLIKDGVLKNAYAIQSHRFPEENFMTFWMSLNGYRSWSDNPWVWVIEFKRI